MYMDCNATKQNDKAMFSILPDCYSYIHHPIATIFKAYQQKTNAVQNEIKVKTHYNTKNIMLTLFVNKSLKQNLKYINVCIYVFA